MFEAERVADWIATAGDLLALSHAGHGLNSYGLNLVVARGPVAAFVQHGYGGAFMEPVSMLTGIAATYARSAPRRRSRLVTRSRARPSWARPAPLSTRPR